MKASRLIPFMLIVLLLLLACGCNQGEVPTPSTTEVGQPTPDATREGAKVGSPRFSLLVAASDSVKLKRDGWSADHKTLFGTILFREDLLQSEEDITILCDDLTLTTIAAGVPASVESRCPPKAEPALSYPGGEVDKTRAAVDLSIPYIITPRMTRLLTDRPILRWNEVVSATSYTVNIQVGGEPWQEVVNGTETVYSGDPPLEAGDSYLLTVTADNKHKRASTEEEPTKLGFVLLSDEEAKPVRADMATLNALDLSHEANALALALLYSHHNLRAEAINNLEELAQAGNQSPAIYRLLGTLYQQIGLPLLAEEHYLQAITLSQAANDIEGLAIAQAGLGDVYTTLNNKEEAPRWYSEALASYEKLGDEGWIGEIGRRLGEE